MKERRFFRRAKNRRIGHRRVIGLGIQVQHEAITWAAHQTSCAGAPADEVAGIAMFEVFHQGKGLYSCNSSHNNTHAMQIPMKDRISIIV